MDQNLFDQREKLAAHLIKRLNRRRMEASFAATASQAKAEILAMIQGPASVMRCGSESVGGLDLWGAMAKIPGVELLDPYKPGLSPEEAFDLRRRCLLTDYMVASTNALTLDGKLVNLDGTGNRVAAMIFGPRKVILLVGMNKVVADVEAAMARVRTIAAPANNIRIGKSYPGYQNPCMEDGRCHDCNSKTRICNAWTIIEGSTVENRIHVKLVAEDLGF